MNCLISLDDLCRWSSTMERKVQKRRMPGLKGLWIWTHSWWRWTFYFEFVFNQIVILKNQTLYTLQKYTIRSSELKETRASWLLLELANSKIARVHKKKLFYRRTWWMMHEVPDFFCCWNDFDVFYSKIVESFFCFAYQLVYKDENIKIKRKQFVFLYFWMNHCPQKGTGMGVGGCLFGVNF